MQILIIRHSLVNYVTVIRMNLKIKIGFLFLLLFNLIALLIINVYTKDDKVIPEPSFYWNGVTYILTYEPVKESIDPSQLKDKKITYFGKGLVIGHISKKINKHSIPKKNGESNYLSVGEPIYDTSISSKTVHSYYVALVVKFDNEYRIARPTMQDIVKLNK